MIRILHLTDFHLNTKTLTDWNEYYKEAFFKKIEELKKEKKIDLILFTGDIIDQGGLSFKEEGDEISPQIKAFNTFKEEVIDILLHELNLDISRFIICPGNHDINRFADDEIDEIGLKGILTSSEKVIDFIKKSDDNNSYKRIERIKDYKIFEQELYKDIKQEKLHSIFNFSLIVDIEGKKVGISSLNSSWRCYGDSDYGNLLIGENQINSNYQFIKDCDLKIGLVHHQFDWLSKIEQKTIKNHVSINYDLVLSGHVHSSATEYIQNNSGECLYCISPSGLNNIRQSESDHLNGFTLIDYDYDEVKFHYLNYNHHLKNL